jgi:hypothetical protein
MKGRRRKAERGASEAVTALREAVVDTPGASWDAPHLDALQQALQRLDRLLEHAVTAAQAAYGGPVAYGQKTAVRLLFVY